MSIKDCIKEPLKFPVSVCLTESDFIRWKKINKAIGEKVPNAALSELARKKLLSLMNEVEQELEQYQPQLVIPR